MKHRLVPKPTMTPFVTKSPAMLYEAHPFRIFPNPREKHPSSAELRVPSRRMMRAFTSAAKETKATAVEPMNESVESFARWDALKRAWTIPHEYVNPMWKKLGTAK